MCNEPRQLLAPLSSQEATTVQRMESSSRKLRGIADIMQIRSRYECFTASSKSRGDPLS